jgi:hypothetical protein
MLKNFKGLRRVIAAKCQFRIYARQKVELHQGILSKPLVQIIGQRSRRCSALNIKCG